MNCTLAQVIAAGLVASGQSPESALTDAHTACKALDLPGDAIVPLVVLGAGDSKAGDPERVNAETFMDNHETGVRYAEQPGRSPMAISQGKPRYCHKAGGGCGAKLDSSTLMYYQSAGPKPKLQSGDFKGREYGMSIEVDCYKRLMAETAPEPDGE